MADANALRGKAEYEGALFEVTDALLEDLAGAAREVLGEAKAEMKSARIT